MQCTGGVNIAPGQHSGNTRVSLLELLKRRKGSARAGDFAVVHPIFYIRGRLHGAQKAMQTVFFYIGVQITVQVNDFLVPLIQQVAGSGVHAAFVVDQHAVYAAALR